MTFNFTLNEAIEFASNMFFVTETIWQMIFAITNIKMWSKVIQNGGKWYRSRSW